MRYFIRLKTPESPAGAVLKWLLNIDSTPTVLPVFPENENTSLVVAHLLSGEVLAEVLPHSDTVTEACGKGLPLGRLYFQIPRDRLYSVCEGLTPEVFGGSDKHRAPFF